MRKIRKVSEIVTNVFSNITATGFIIAFTFTSVGAAIWSVKWVLRLLGVM